MWQHCTTVARNYFLLISTDCSFAMYSIWDLFTISIVRNFWKLKFELIMTDSWQMFRTKMAFHDYNACDPPIFVDTILLIKSIQVVCKTTVRDGFLKYFFLKTVLKTIWKSLIEYETVFVSQTCVINEFSVCYFEKEIYYLKKIFEWELLYYDEFLLDLFKISINFSSSIYEDNFPLIHRFNTKTVQYKPISISSLPWHPSGAQKHGLYRQFEETYQYLLFLKLSIPGHPHQTLRNIFDVHNLAQVDVLRVGGSLLNY